MSEADRLEKGPGYLKSEGKGRPGNDDENWPTYRHDAARTGRAMTRVPASLARAWRQEIGGRLSAVTVAEDKVFVSAIDNHTIHALDAKSGKPAWSYTVGARVDSPPTIHKGFVLFGSNDGHVYSLRASDGTLAWRYRVAPTDEQIMSYNQLESVWPIHGSVLIQDDTLYAVAGRSMFLDGGLRFVRLNPTTGKTISETIFDGVNPNTGAPLEDAFDSLSMTAALPDVLASDGKRIFMRSNIIELDGSWPQVKTDFDFSDQKLEDAHLFCPAGFLDDNWLHRVYWLYGSTFKSGCNTWHEAGRYVPAGRILVYDDQTAYGFGRKHGYFVWSSALEYHLFATQKNYDPAKIAAGYEKVKKENANTVKQLRFDRLFSRDNLSKYTPLRFEWSVDDPPFQARALALADGTLFAAGPPDVVDEEQSFGRYQDPEIRAKLEQQKSALEGKEGALLWAMSAADGQRLSQLALDSPPVFDGMAAANGRLYTATMDGSVQCFGPME